MAKLKFQPIKRQRKARASGAGEAAATKPTKLATIATLLQRPDGARMEDLVAATGWQSHSVRGAISGVLKKHLQLSVISEQTPEGRVYRIPAQTQA